MPEPSAEALADRLELMLDQIRAGQPPAWAAHVAGLDPDVLNDPCLEELISKAARVGGAFLMSHATRRGVQESDALLKEALAMWAGWLDTGPAPRPKPIAPPMHVEIDFIE